VTFKIKNKMSDFDYKKYLKKNPLLEKMTDEEREDKLQQAIRGGGKEEPLRKLAALGKKADFGPEHGAVDDEYEKTLDPDYDKADEDEDAYERRLGLEEALNPEVTKTVNNLIKAMAKKYGYEEKDAVFAIQAALKQREFDNKLNEANLDGTISPDEGDREDMLMTNVESSIDDLLSMAKKEAYNIGSEFRGPGIWNRVKKLIKSKL
jgi:hypothetical protein